MMPESIEIDESTAKVYRHNVQHGFLSFEIGSVTKAHEFGLGHRPEYPVMWSIFVVVSADDVKSESTTVKIDMANPKSPVSLEQLA